MKKLYFSLSFILIFGFTQAQELCFDPSNDSRYEAGNGTQKVAKGDFNEDNHLDIAAINYLDGSISIFLGNGDGTFQSQIVIDGLPGAPEDVVVSDFNSDNNADILVSMRSSSENLALVTGNGDGTFNAVSYSELGLSTFQFRKLELADVDNDNIPDIAYDIALDSSVHIIKTVGDGTFSLLDSKDMNGRPWDMSMRDFSGDNIPDLVVSYLTTTPYVSLYVNNGDGTFGAETQFPINYSGTYADCILARLDSDNNYDLAVHSGGYMMIWQGDGATGFTLIDEINIGAQPDMLMAGNLDNTGYDDICWVQGSSQAVETLLDTANFNYDQVSSFGTLGDSKHGVLGDFNEDGELDIVSACYSEDYITFTEGQSDGSFGSYELRTYGPAQGVVSYDFDGDNHLDIVAVNGTGTSTMAFIKGNGDGSFQPSIVTETDGSGTNVVAANVDGDADMDVLISRTGGILLVEHNDGSGNFSDEDIYSLGLGGGGQEIAVGDFNNDTWPDAVLSHENTDIIYMFINTQTDSFAAPVSFATGTSPAGIYAADLNDNDYDDVVVANAGSNNISVFINDQSGGFAAGVTYPTGALCYDVTIADFNGDQIPDIATVNNNGATVSVLLGNGNGTFQAATSFAIAQSVSAIRITHGLIDNDSELDLCVVYAIGNEVALLTGNGDGTFNSPVAYATGDYPNGIALGDFNEDGAMDISTSNGNTNNVSVILNSSAFVTVDGSTQICDGESVTLTANGGYSYLWSTGETTNSIEATDEATYSVAITNQAGDCSLVPPSVDVTVNLAPIVTYNNLSQADQCALDDELQLIGGQPQGGVYSGLAVVNGLFNPSVAGAGTHTIYYSYTDPAECFTVMDSADYIVHPDVEAINDFPLEVLCLGSDPVVLANYGSPSGGQWNIDNVLQTEFNPQTLGLGTYETSYIAENVACVDTAFMTVEVINAVTATMEFPTDTLCMDYGLLQLEGGEPSGGEYFGSGVSAGIMDPIALGAGTHSIGYGYDPGGGCSDTTFANIEVVDSAYAEIVSELDYICLGDVVITIELTGSPAGGTYFGPSVIGDQFHPYNALEGIHTVGYTYTNVYGCLDSAFTDIEVEVCAGIHELSKNSMQVYPNPSSNGFNISFVDDNVLGELELRNTLGQILWSRNIKAEKSIRIEENWPAGNYLLLLKTDTYIGTERLTVVK